MQDEINAAVRRVREVLEVRATALADLQVAARAGRTTNDGMSDRMTDILWANKVVVQEAEKVGKTPQWLMGAAGY